MEAEPVRETYVFRCADCGNRWEDVYEIRRTWDNYGLLQDSFFLDGARSASPLTHTGCRFCADVHVQALGHQRVHSGSARPV